MHLLVQTCVNCGHKIDRALLSAPNGDRISSLTGLNRHIHFTKKKKKVKTNNKRHTSRNRLQFLFYVVQTGYCRGNERFLVDVLMAVA